MTRRGLFRAISAVILARKVGPVPGCIVPTISPVDWRSIDRGEYRTLASTVNSGKLGDCIILMPEGAYILDGVGSVALFQPGLEFPYHPAMCIPTEDPYSRAGSRACDFVHTSPRIDART